MPLPLLRLSNVFNDHAVLIHHPNKCNVPLERGFFLFGPAAQGTSTAGGLMAPDECVKFNSCITQLMPWASKATLTHTRTDPGISHSPSGLYKGLDISTGTCRSLTPRQLSSCCWQRLFSAPPSWQWLHTCSTESS